MDHPRVSRKFFSLPINHSAFDAFSNLRVSKIVSILRKKILRSNVVAQSVEIKSPSVVNDWAEPRIVPRVPLRSRRDDEAYKNAKNERAPCLFIVGIVSKGVSCRLGGQLLRRCVYHRSRVTFPERHTLRDPRCLSRSLSLSLSLSLVACVQLQRVIVTQYVYVARRNHRA